jgi:phenylalanyl-tRNA synthetase beta chain
MKVSLEWLSQFVDVSDLDPNEIADRITTAFAEVENVARLDRSLDGVMVGELVSIEPVPGQSDLKLVAVDCGEQTFITLCGAPNLKIGIKSAFAPAGFKTAQGTTVTTCAVAGHRSDGILCSPRDLGLSDFHDSVFEVAPSLPKGALLSKLIPASDTVMEIDNKSITHRPDLWGHYGIARELAAIFTLELRPLKIENVDAYSKLPQYPVNIRDPNGCPCYGCIEISNVSPIPSPLYIQWRLHALDQRSTNVLVDLTNYIMLELGQPMHAFDAEQIHAISVAPFGKEGPFTSLDGVERELIADDLMIWSESEPIAIAGIIGGLTTEVRRDTCQVLLESASFRGSRIGRTARRLGLWTEAARRFDKDQPPSNTKLGIARFLSLCDDADMNPNVLSCLTVQGDPKVDMRRINIPVKRFHQIVGVKIGEERLTSILDSLGFKAEVKDDQLQVDVPPFRSASDISIPEDIVEEVCRIYGYENIAAQMPKIVMQPVHLNQNLRTEHKARRLLSTAHSFIEVHTYSWFYDLWLERLQFDPGKTLVVANPSAEHQSRLRTTLVPNLLAVVTRNINYRDDFRIFELGHIYRPTEDSGCREGVNLCGISCRRTRIHDLESHYRSIRGVLEDLVAVIDGMPIAVEPCNKNEAPWWTTGGHGHIEHKKSLIGTIGILSDAIHQEIGPNIEVVGFEIEIDKLTNSLRHEIKYIPSSAYPESWTDFSIVWPSEVGLARLEQKLDMYSHPLVTKRQFLYIYKGEELPRGMASYTFRYYIGSREKTLTREEIERFRHSLLTFLQSERLELR